MTVHGLMGKLAEVSAGEPDLNVEVRAIVGDRIVKSELLDDAKAGEEVFTAARFDEYIEDICVGVSERGGCKKVCITADAV